MAIRDFFWFNGGISKGNLGLSTFVYLEIADKGLTAFFAGLSQVIYGILPDKAPHLTLRGPYAGQVPLKVIELCKARLEAQFLRMGKVGRFSNGIESVVYFSVENPVLRDLWWKPDYPISEFGFNPHISIYRGPDKGLAERIEKFFDREKVDVFCDKYRIVTHVSKQLELLPNSIPLYEYPFHNIVVGRLKENLLSRLGVVIERHKRRPSLVMSV